ncbi:MAG: hypothetical protein H6712_16370 [Myxococcales bacterium]|nr:hypothetical protein [Myxococcales bacterium]MCB9715445.1 hypothetical protein [Myxococcales bacterium]
MLPRARLGRSVRAREALAALGLLLLAMLALRLPPWGLGEAIVSGTEPCGTVPLAMAWTLGWSFDRFDAGLSGYWNAPIFHSTPGTFALSEPMPLVAALAWPAHLLGASLAAATNLALLTQLWLDGWLVRRWLRRLGVGRALGTAGGAIVVVLPFVHQELGVLPLVPVWGIAWMLTALHELLGPGRRPSLRAGVELGLATGASWLCSEQLTFFAVLLLGPCALALLRRRHLVRALPLALGSAALTAGVGVLPVALPQRHALSSLGLRRPAKSRREGGARPVELARTPWRGLVPLPSSLVAKRPSDRAFEPGPLRTVVALGGAAHGLRRRRWRRPVAMLLVLIVGAALLALGAHLRLGPFVPAEGLARVLPGYDRIRSVFRAVVLAQLGVVALCTVGLHAWRTRQRLHRRRSPRGWLAPALVAGLAVVELWPPAPHVTSMPDADARWVSWLRDTEPGAAMAWLPFAPSGDVCDFEPTARMMVLGLELRHPLVNGYSSYFPGRTDRTARDTRTLPEPRALQRLRGVHTRFIVSPRDGPLSELDASTLAALGVEPAFDDPDAGIVVVRLLEPPTGDGP